MDCPNCKWAIAHVQCRTWTHFSYQFDSIFSLYFLFCLPGGCSFPFVMAATTAIRFSLIAPFLAIVILGTFYQSSSYGVAGHNLRTISSGGASGGQIHRNLLAATSAQRKPDQQLPSCGELAGKLPCLKNSRCRWCRSEALDDMCFSKSEAFRLPSQVFSCDWSLSL